MKKPNPKNYGLDTPLWNRGGKKAYETACIQWVEYREKYGITAGRPRSADRPIHPSWDNYTKHFNPYDPTRSQNAFCNWAKIRPSSLSAAKRKPITDRMELKISEWLEMLWIGDGEGLDGSMNTNADRVKNALSYLGKSAEKGAASIDDLGKIFNKLEKIGDNEQQQ